MITLFSKEEYESAKNSDLLQCKCEFCSKTFYTSKRHISFEIKHNRNQVRFCSRICFIESTKKKPVTCLVCGKNVKRRQVKRSSRTSNKFCCRSHAAYYNNTHKTTGIRRSRLESFVSRELEQRFDKILFLFNNRSAIGYELDIYIPSLAIAFELNGIVHYRPIFGEEKFKNIQRVDNEKSLRCGNVGVHLYIIDTSSQQKFTEDSSACFLQRIVNVIESEILRREKESNPHPFTDGTVFKTDYPHGCFPPTTGP
jgi:hypothetical protein